MLIFIQNVMYRVREIWGEGEREREEGWGR